MTDVEQPVTGLYGLVLAGGQSTRMGHDKSLIDYHGKPQREYLFSMLERFCADVYTSCRPGQNIPPHLHPLPDHFDLSSPLNGILSAFRFNSSAAWLTVPVDMPLVDESIIRFLIGHRDRDKYATCFYDSDGENPEPLLTLWEPHAAPALMRFFSGGGMSPKKFLMDHGINVLAVPDKRALLNINNPDDLALIRKNLK
jgi:molybdopterin-guanine dinucleotide biosynthesis protein A